jgi:hypothetical protein
MTEQADRLTLETQIAALPFLTRAEQEIINDAIRTARHAYGYEIEPHYCFRNAQTVLVSDFCSPTGSNSIQYFEGFVPSPDGAAPHAWIEINEKIVDITLMCSEAGLRVLPKIRYYVKREVPIGDVRNYFQSARAHRAHGSILGLKLTPYDQL